MPHLLAAVVADGENGGDGGGGAARVGRRPDAHAELPLVRRVVRQRPLQPVLLRAAVSGHDYTSKNKHRRNIDCLAMVFLAPESSLVRNLAANL